MIRGLAYTPDATVLKLIDHVLAGPYSYPDQSAALYALKKFDIDWRRRALDVATRPNQNVSLKQAAYRAIATVKDDVGFELLVKAFEEEDDRGRNGLLSVITTSYPLEKTYERFVEPYLTKSAAMNLRSSAMRALSREKDSRFHQHARRLAEEVPPYQAGYWITYAEPFGNLEALKTMIAIATAAGDKASSYLTRSVPKLTDPAVTEWLTERGLTHEMKGVRDAALAALRTRSHPAAVDPLKKLVKSPDRETARRAIESLGVQKGDGVVKFLRKLWTARDPLIASEALGASWKAESGSGKIVADLIKVAKRSRAWEMRLIAMGLLKVAHAQEVKDVLVANARHKRGQVRSEAYDALTYVREKETVDFLLRRLESEKGRSLYDLVDALVDLTGFDYGRNAKNWSSWWKRVRGEYPLPPKPKVKKRSAPPAGYASYYGIAVRSNRVAFVIDISGSMSSRGTGVSKIQKAKDNLKGVLEQFTADTRFGIIAFESRVTAFQSELLRANRNGKKEANDWVDALKATSGTNVYDALIMALDLPSVDTVFLLSDGAPSAGAITDQDEIIRVITSKNRFRRIRINTIGISVAGGTAKFMKELAERNFGEFVSR